MTKEPTIQDVLEAISEFSTRVDQRFDSVEHRLGTVEHQLGTVESDVGSLKSRVANIEATMVTKDYLNGRLDAVHGSIVYSRP
ncbi:MAG: hypothetical protein V1745_01565 [Patescibacteria group bacterium]